MLILAINGAPGTWDSSAAHAGFAMFAIGELGKSYGRVVGAILPCLPLSIGWCLHSDSPICTYRRPGWGVNVLMLCPPRPGNLYHHHLLASLRTKEGEGYK